MDQGDIGIRDNEAIDGFSRSTDRNKPTTLADIEFQASDEHSQDIFNDNESAQNSPSINFDVSDNDIIKVNSTPGTDHLHATLTQTPKVFKNDRSPYHPTVPRIPTSLVPFISIVNESWNSDLETPQAKTEDQNKLGYLERSGQLIKSYETMESKECGSIRSNGVIPDVTTPSGCFVGGFENENLSSSPILNTMVKRRRPKRRILTSLDATISKDSSKQVNNICHTPANDCETKEIENFRSEATDESQNNETLIKNDTSIVINTIFGVDENFSLHNSNIDVIEDKINHVEINLPSEDQSVKDISQDSTLIANLNCKDIALDREECFMNERLRSCEDLGDTCLNDTLKNEAGIIRSSELTEKVLVDYVDFESQGNKFDDKSLAECVGQIQEIQELQEKKEQIAECEYSDIPIDVFTRDAKALENAEMIPIKPLTKSNVNRQWGLISFTQMCLLEQEIVGNKNLDINEIDKTDSPNIDHEFSQNVPEDKVRTSAKSVVLSFEDDNADMVDIFASSFREKDEPAIDIDEFSPWFYQSNERRLQLSNSASINTENLTKENVEGVETQIGMAEMQEIPMREETRPASKVEDNNSIYCPPTFTINKTKIQHNAELCVKGTAARDGVNHNSKTFSTETTNSNYLADGRKKISENLQQSIGFFTASGTPITISEDKIKMASKLYEEIAEQDGKHYDGQILHEMTGIHRTNNKKDEAIINRNFDGSMGFSTASGKSIKISEHKLKDAVKLYDDLNSMAESPLPFIPTSRGIKRRHECYSADSDQISGVDSSIGFRTAFGKPLIVSETAMKKARMMYQSEDIFEGQLLQSIDSRKELERCKDIRKNTLSIENFDDKCKTHSKSLSSSSFASASAGHVQMKGTASVIEAKHTLYDEDTYELQKLRSGSCKETNLISDIESNILENLSKGMPSTYETRSDKMLPGFCTANGKSLAISYDAFQKAKKTLLDDLSDDTDDNQISEDLGNVVIKSTNAFDSLPSLRRNNTVINDNLINELQKTDNARNQTSKTFTEQEQSLKKYHSIDYPINAGISDATTSFSAGFSTASGTAIKISDQALLNARILWKETENGGGTSRSICETDNTDAFVGFSTANGKQIKVSDQALLNAKILLSDGENSYKTNQPELDRIDGNRDTIGFSATDGKTIKISANGSAKAKMLFGDEQENTPPHHYSMKRDSAVLETPMDTNVSVSTGHAFKPVLEDTFSCDTPVGVSIFETSKRVRFNTELQARKLFDENGSDTDEEMENAERVCKENIKCPRTPLNSNSNFAHHPLSHERKKNDLSINNHTVGIYAKSEMFEINDRLMNPKLKPQKSCPLNQEILGKFNTDNTRLTQVQKDRRISTYSDEITASTEALLADEENSLNGRSWALAITCSPTVLEDRDISVKPITLGEGCDIIQEVPTSPVIGAKFRSRKKNKRNKKSTLKRDKLINSRTTKGNGLSVNADLEEQVITEESQQSSETATLTSNSSKGSHRNIMSPGIETMLKLKFQKREETLKSIRFVDNQSEDPVKLVLRETEDIEMIDDFLENRIAATLEQEKQIRAKKKLKPKPIVGSLLLRRTMNGESRISWQKATNGVLPEPRTSCELTNLGIGPDVKEMTAATALSYRFKCSDFYSKDEIRLNVNGKEMSDGGRLIFDENGFAGAVEFHQAFMASPGVDPALVPERWVENHYRWIVWKLASMDRTKFGDLPMPRMLTPHHVMEQLKYRYDREIDKSQRPALRKIIEKDDPASRRMILCVATITKLEDTQALEKSPKVTPTSHWKVELTDGWYGITATIDSAMAHLIAFGKVREGTKLITCRAELLNCDQGCYPLEIPAEASLKIHTNSTRRCKWDSKLGYCKYAGPIPTSLSAVLPNGGLIGKLDTIIARVYPIQYYEKTRNGQSIFRNNKCEDKAAAMYEKERQEQIDKIYTQARADFEARNQKHSKSLPSILSSKSSQIGTKLCRNDWSTSDPDSSRHQESFQSYHKTSEEAFQSELESILHKSLPPPRKVTVLIKVRLMENENLAMLTMWSPSEDMIDILKEGNRVSIHNVQTFNGKRSGELQLSAGHRSFVKREESNVSSFPQRCLTSISEVAIVGFNPPFCEFDTVGIVVSLGPAPHGMKNFEVVNLAYPNPDLSGSTYLSILFWERVEAYGFTDILTIGSIVACANLQWRRGAHRTIPVVYSTEHSIFTRNPRQAYLRLAFDSVKNQITDPSTYASQCAMEIAVEHQKKSTNLCSPGVQGTPSKTSSSASVIQDKFVSGLTPQTPQSLLNSGGISSAKYSVQRRLEKLQWYGEPPELSPIALNRSSSKVKQKFVPPARTPEH